MLGYGQAAVKLQQFWLQEKDPQSLPFAQRIDRRALVALVHKGLKYHQIEQLHSKVCLFQPFIEFHGLSCTRPPLKMGYPPPHFFSALKLAEVSRRLINNHGYKMDQQHHSKPCPLAKVIAILL